MNIYILISLVILIILFLHFRITEPTQQEIQSLTYAKQKSPDFIFPQISHGFKQLSKGNIKPINNLIDILPNNKDNVDLIREAGRDVNNRFYIPDYLRKDTLPQNNINSEEMRPFIIDDNVIETSWTDSNVSEHPKYYTNDFQNNLTNPGTFFDKNNQFNDTTSSNTFTLPSDNCYVTRTGETFCKDNTRIQNIPPKLINDPESTLSLNRIGTYKDIDKNNPYDILTSDEKLFDAVYPSRKMGNNETFDKPLTPIISTF